MRGLKKNRMGKGHTNKQTDTRTSQLLERIGLSADSLKSKFTQKSYSKQLLKKVNLLKKWGGSLKFFVLFLLHHTSYSTIYPTYCDLGTAE